MKQTNRLIDFERAIILVAGWLDGWLAAFFSITCILAGASANVRVDKRAQLLQVYAKKPQLLVYRERFVVVPSSIATYRTIIAVIKALHCSGF